MNSAMPEPGDAQLMTDLKRMWERVDPMPGDLPDRVLFALDLEELDVDFELLRLVENAERDLSVRNTATVNTITFSGPSVTVMLRVSELSGSRRRLDGWLAWTAPLRVTIHHEEGTCEPLVDERGRFVAEDIPAGMTRLVLTAADDDQAPLCITPTVEI
ncbi:MAG: hypothetical protein ACR2JK_19180 [Geodermatophilaceae bacterium]